MQHKLMKAAVAVVMITAFELMFLSWWMESEAKREIRYKITATTVAKAIMTRKRTVEMDRITAGNFHLQKGTRGSKVFVTMFI